jgi:hypothetical protein
MSETSTTSVIQNKIEKLLNVDPTNVFFIKSNKIIGFCGSITFRTIVVRTNFSYGIFRSVLFVQTFRCLIINKTCCKKSPPQINTPKLHCINFVISRFRFNVHFARCNKKFRGSQKKVRLYTCFVSC